MKVQPLTAWSNLTPLLDRPLEIIDVGCRWGPAEHWIQLDRVRVVGFDPDPDECRELNEKFSAKADIRFVPLALGPFSGTKTLHITREPACSSFYPPDISAIQAHPSLRVAAPLEVKEVETVTLDEWLASEGYRPVDFIKLDTQGSELGVLQGSTKALPAVQAVETEVQFNAIYEGVPLFGDVDGFLREFGFVLWRLSDLAHYGLAGGISDFHRQEVQYFDSYPSQLAGRGGQIFWGNAFYVRKEMLGNEFEPDWQLSLRRACIGAALGFHDLAQTALENCSRAAPTGTAAPKEIGALLRSL